MKVVSHFKYLMLHVACDFFQYIFWKKTPMFYFLHNEYFNEVNLIFFLKNCNNKLVGCCRVIAETSVYFDFETFFFNLTMRNDPTFLWDATFAKGFIWPF